LVFISSTITMMHGPINISLVYLNSWYSDLSSFRAKELQAYFWRMSWMKIASPRHTTVVVQMLTGGSQRY